MTALKDILLETNSFYKRRYQIINMDKSYNISSFIFESENFEYYDCLHEK